MYQTLAAFVFSCFIIASALPSVAQTIVQSRGADSRVDYASLTRFGPWDDRNYQLTQEDLRLLGENEEELHVVIPVFYRVELRKRFVGMPRTGILQYPHSALPRFWSEYGGFLVDGRLYRNGYRDDGGFHVDLDGPSMGEEEFEAKALVGDVRVTSPTGAAESAVAIRPTDPDRVIAGVNGPGYGQYMHYSTNGGETWTPAATLPLGGTCCDPTVAWSSDGTKAYTATLGASAVYFYRSGDNGQTWTDLQIEPGSDPRRELGSGTDKEYLHVDTAPGSSCLDHLYLTWHENWVMKLAHSSDRGHTWSTSTISSGTNQMGIGSDIVSDKTGNVYYLWPAPYSQKILVRKSADCGISFASVVDVASTLASYEFPIPSMDDRRVFVYVSAAADRSNGPYGGSVYAAWTDSTGPTGSNPANNHARIQVAYSRDDGATWHTTTPHETADASSVDRWHQWIAVAEDGTVHVVFYDTRRDPTRSSVDLFWSFSTDGAQTFSSPSRLTSEQSPAIFDFFQFGDYNGLDVVADQLIAIFTDNRNEIGGGGDSVDVYAAGAALDSSMIFSDDFETGDLTRWSYSNGS